MRRTGAVLVLASIGLATEFGSAATFTVTKTADTADGACEADCSLREAVIAANADPDADVINVPAGTYLLSRGGADEDAASTGDLDILEPVSIVGAGSGTTTIDAGGADRIFHVKVSNRGRARIQGFTIVDGSATGEGQAGRGGAIYALASRLDMIGCVVTTSDAATGGGLMIESDDTDRTGIELNLLGCTFSENTSTGSGAGVRIGLHVEKSRISNSMIVENTAGADGGGLWIGTSGPVDVVGSTISNNRGRNGGGVFTTSTGTVSFRRSVVESNTARSNGAGINTMATTVNFVAGALRANVLDDNIGIAQHGGGLYAQGAGLDGGFTILDSEVSGNVAEYGGGIENFNGDFLIRGSTFSGNMAMLAGGAMRFNFGNHVIENSTISGNSVSSNTGFNGEQGGAAVSYLPLTDLVTTTLTNVTIADNTAPINGQQIFCNRCNDDTGIFFRNSVVAGDGAFTDCMVRFDVGTPKSEGGNLSTDPSCGFVEATDQESVADMMVGMLGDNGGVTPTLPLLPGSPAVGAAVDANCPADDQRGFGRDGDCDAGAFERGVSEGPLGCGADLDGTRTQLAYVVEEILDAPDVGVVVFCLGEVAGAT